MLNRTDPEAPPLSFEEIWRLEYGLLAKRVVLYGIVVNSALYLTLVVVIALATSNPIAWKLGLAAIGVTYVSYMLQVAEGENQRYAAYGAVVCSIVLGLLAGLTLLLR